MPNSIFAFPQMTSLLDAERRLIERRTARMAAATLLVIEPRPDGMSLLAGARQTACRLHVADQRLAGSVSCAPDALPWPDEHFELVVARHAPDALPAGSGIEAELARVLAPGGTLILSGLNPFSPWRLWWARECRDGLRVPTSRNPSHARRVLESLGLEYVDRAFVGGSWPRREPGAIDLHGEEQGARWHGAWILVVRKRAAAVRPIPLRRAARRSTGLAPSFVPSSSGRLRA